MFSRAIVILRIKFSGKGKRKHNLNRYDLRNSQQKTKATKKVSTNLASVASLISNIT